MAKIVFNSFKGVAPKVHPLQLGEGYAQSAVNIRLDRGRLEPLHGLLNTGEVAPSNTETVFLYEGQYWFTSASDVTFTPAPLNNDPYDYVCIAGNSYPQVTRNDVALVTSPYPSTSYRLGVPTPSNPCSVALSGTPPEEPDPLDQETVSYVHTFVDSWGRESPPNLSSASIDVYFPGESVLVGLNSPPSGDWPFGIGAKKRIYRSNTGTDSTSFQFVAEVDIGALEYEDSIESQYLGEVIPSTTWDGPPDDDTALYPDGPLFWMDDMPNSFLIGVTKREVCFSEINVLHAWPIDYRKPIRSEIVGAAVIGQGALILTKSNPYLCYGSDPASMSLSKMESNQACSSKLSIVPLEESVLYASPDGLCGLVNGRIEVLTEGLISQDEWQALAPTTIKGYAYEGMYIGFYNALGIGGDRGGFVFDPRKGTNNLVFLDFYSNAGVHYDDHLYLLKTDNQIAKFNKDTENPLNMAWKSRRVKLEQATNFAVMKIISSDYPVNVKVRAFYDSLEVADNTYTIENSTPIYLDSGFIANEWEVEITGNASPVFITLANSWEEM